MTQCWYVSPDGQEVCRKPLIHNDDPTDRTHVSEHWNWDNDDYPTDPSFCLDCHCSNECTTHGRRMAHDHND